ncbi:MAG TPA: toll/interleukin-1 receptor domain-containing protein [Solirubrobacterales bacterium]
MPTIFISYRRRDTGGHVGRLREDLKKRYGERAVFTDFGSIPPGAKYRKKIEEALKDSDVALVVIGEDWVAKKAGVQDDDERRIDEHDDVLRSEVASALTRENLTVIPVLVEDADLPAAADLPDDLLALREYNACHLGNKGWDSDFAQIRRAIDAADPEGGPRRFVASARIAAGEHRVAVLGTVAALAAALFIVLAIGGHHDEGCENLDLPPEKRDELSVAAGTTDPAEEGVFYGSCKSHYWAIAEFPHQDSSVFIQENLHWRRLGPAPVECKQVPPELLHEWNEYEC